MIFTVVFTVFFFTTGRLSVSPKEFPGFDLSRLKHPLYQTAYLKPDDDIWYSDYQTARAQQDELEGFMQFANYTNLSRKTGNKITLENGTVVDETVRSYDPSTD